MASSVAPQHLLGHEHKLHSVQTDQKNEHGESPAEDHPSTWPSLSSQENDDWEVVPNAPLSPVVTFDPAAIISEKNPSQQNPKILHHCASSPDFRHLTLAEDDDDESDVLMKDESSMASSAVMVSGPSSVWSVSSNRLSFRDAILQNKGDQQPMKDSQKDELKKPKKALKTRFVVVKPDAQTSVGLRRNTRSMGNLRALDHIQEDHDQEVLGETDADHYYSRKAQGALGRKNGQKIRPDEAKRLQMIMTKKSAQRQRQLGRS